LYFAVAKSRNIGVPGDLEAQIDALFAKSQMVQKHTKLWLSSANRGRVDTIHSRDYRNIVEGLQVAAFTVLVFSVHSWPSLIINVSLRFFIAQLNLL